MLFTRELLEQRERETLAPYAAKSGDSRGRAHPDDEHPYRTAFQKDRDRIIHTTAFRRLEYKTQVFVYHEGDHYRNRLTHTIEVAQIGRTLARALGANEDLVEAICLAHDLGHPPFGHTGEQVLNQLMADHGGFDHQRHTMRIVEKLEERYPGFPGLNLTYEVREGLVKHDTDYDVTNAEGYEPELAGTLECQLANLADEIAYNTADLEDGLRSGVLDPGEVAGLAVWQTVRRSLAADPEFPVPVDAPLTDLVRARAIRRLIGAEVTDAVYTTAHRLRAHGAQSVDEVRRAGEPLAAFSPEMLAMNRELKAFLLQRFYHHWRVVRMAGKAERILTALFSVYRGDPRQLPPPVQARMARGDEPRERVICDYIAGMTDRYAIQEYQRLFDPEARV
ncbi:MAG: deoxyguanosinetriphosphate triphosphohydrolase [Caldilineales bacterium]|nr:deoxyguanosinetriphosphate triphosphohydrolase [Caldilineales bacterium]MDW8319277.1 deoxyguanosinetriphosphate triphosphohydrolase [Anaerolineae bacterium]